MNSSTSSSSEVLTSDDLSWRRWIWTFFAALAVGFAALYAIVVVSDPFCVGRFTIFNGIDVAISERAYANAGRARDPRFDAAVIGNSHGARFEPARLDQLTGRHFVQLAVPGTNPEQQIVVAQAFLRDHPGKRVGLLWVLDHYWCRGDGDVYPNFPYWLYDTGGPATYLLRLFSTRAVQAAFHRIGIRLFNAPPAGRADGYVAAPPPARPEVMAKVVTAERPTAAPPAETPLIWADRMDALISALPNDVRVVLVFLPNYVSSLPQDGSPAAARLEMCKQRFAAIAGRSSQVAFVDRMRDDSIARDPNNFIDATHTTDSVIRQLESDFASVITADIGRSR
jgi:hypothetical protein